MDPLAAPTDSVASSAYVARALTDLAYQLAAIKACAGKIKGGHHHQAIPHYDKFEDRYALLIATRDSYEKAVATAAAEHEFARRDVASSSSS
jgi:predicted GTPase